MYDATVTFCNEIKKSVGALRRHWEGLVMEGTGRASEELVRDSDRVWSYGLAKTSKDR